MNEVEVMCKCMVSDRNSVLLALYQTVSCHVQILKISHRHWRFRTLDLPPAGHLWNGTCNSGYYLNLILDHYWLVLLHVYLLQIMRSHAYLEYELADTLYPSIVPNPKKS
mgnify:CR=1 FL=1